MDEAIAALRTTRPTFYRWLRGGRLRGLKVGRQWRFERAEVERFLRGEAPRVELPVSIEPLIAKLAARAATTGTRDLPAAECSGPEGAVDLIIRLGAALRASDIHVEPLTTAPGREAAGVVRYRIDGVLHAVAEFDLRLLPAIVERFKALAACDVREKRLPQDGRILIDAGDRKLDLRVCFVGPVMGEAVTVRLLDPSRVLLSLNSIDHTPADRERLLRGVRSAWGLVLVTGPTGSGKTTVLYACLNELAGPEVKTMSLEDPVEFLLPWVTQIPIRPALGLGFAQALRSVLRSDPDVILVGEIRDRETLMVCQQAALTGHLVMSTMHTDEAVSALKRMVEIGSEPFVVAESVRTVVAQRLVRRLCPKCSRPEEPSPEALRRAAELARSGGLGWETLKPGFRGPVGCDGCARTGFRGRTVITEVLEVTPEIGRALREGADPDRLRSLAVSQGMTSMAADGIRRAAAGQVALGEVLQMLGVR
jgi:excisionase family DNA binding protein